MSPTPLKRSEDWKDYKETMKKARSEAEANQRQRQKQFKVKTKFTNLQDFI